MEVVTMIVVTILVVFSLNFIFAVALNSLHPQLQHKIKQDQRAKSVRDRLRKVHEQRQRKVGRMSRQVGRGLINVQYDYDIVVGLSRPKTVQNSEQLFLQSCWQQTESGSTPLKLYQLHLFLFKNVFSRIKWL